jgi:hypothetical protein
MFGLQKAPNPVARIRSTPSMLTRVLCVPAHVAKAMEGRDVQTEIRVDGELARVVSARVTAEGTLHSPELYDVVNDILDIYDVAFGMHKDAMRMDVTTVCPERWQTLGAPKDACAGALDMKDATSTLFAQVMLYFVMSNASEDAIRRFVQVFFMHGMGARWQRRMECWLADELRGGRVHIAVDYLCNMPML